MKHYKHIFVVLVYKNTDVLEGFFKSLEEKVDDYKVVLVNSYFDDVSLSKCKTYAERKNCDFLEIPNKGYGAGNNVGIEYVLNHYSFDFLVISNSDIIIKKIDSLEKYTGKEVVVGPETIMLNKKKQNPGQGRYPTLTTLFFMLCKKGYAKDSHILITFAHIFSRLNKILTYLYVFLGRKKELTVFSIHGSFFIMTEKAVKKLVPVFSDEMFLYNEELYLGLRAKKLKIPVVYTKEIVVNHLEGASSSGDFWKQYPYFKKSFMILNGYIDSGYFENKRNIQKYSFLRLRKLFSNLDKATF